MLTLKFQLQTQDAYPNTHLSVLLLSLETRSRTSNQASGGLDIGRPKQSYMYIYILKTEFNI
ncbi:hypothetical protein Hanom_Chr05g00462531 [Helianthus anomalus]